MPFITAVVEYAWVDLV
jgi:hypothetical protein